MTTSKYMMLFTATAFAFSSCKKNNAPINDSHTVYIAGTTTGKKSMGPIAAYWENGKTNILGTDAKGDYSAANSITIVDTNVYVGGNSNNSNNVDVACYWLHGALHPVNEVPCCTPSEAYSIAVSGNDVYLAGSGPLLTNTVATYWKNGTLNTLPRNGESIATSMAVSGNDVHVAGVDSNAAVYWKNGVATKLTPPNYQSFGSGAYSLFVSGSDVYIAGSEAADNNGTPERFATYWKNGVATHVGLDAANHFNSIFVSGNDIYLAGSSIVNGTPVATYWKNGVATTLSASPYSEAYSIYVLDNDVYVCGVYHANSSTAAVYWKNGTVTYLDGVLAVSIYVK